ncbi:rho GTPase-activating protein 26-like [Paramacrobiotus metropolitanus]|uniref:rho GTPase-activating protein 26-like n=1 Tax=Paramacrobiotus metropolitanus TaxID=2943436 RepID=UPI0024465446|nr:rho GTPase-activating protein 26-like [Paramacrobiotus metropolitanus]
MGRMVLRTLEFKDCTADDPEFRQNLEEHEKELERTSREIKQLIKEFSDVINASQQLSRCQKALAHHLSGFKFENIGQSQTEDERAIAESFKEFGKILSDIEDERTKILDKAMEQFVSPLEDFRRVHIGNVKAEKKKFDKESTKFYQAQEKHLSMSSKKDESLLKEADNDVILQRGYFIQASLRYVKAIQEVHERKKFEFVEVLWNFLSSWMRFFRLSYDITKEFDPYMKDLQERVQKARDSFNAFCAETEALMNKIKTNENAGNLPRAADRAEGFVYLMEKKAFGTTWVKHYCQYDKDSRKLLLVPYSHTHGKATNPQEILTLKSCQRRPGESIEKRFCFDLVTDERPGVMTFQALSEADRGRWMDIMDGKEPVYQMPGKHFHKPEYSTDLNEQGFRFVTLCIDFIEKKGLHEQGLYRVAGVSSKVSRLLHAFFDEASHAQNFTFNLIDQPDVDIRTVTSALKTYFRSLPEPLMTFRMHKAFLSAAKKDNKNERLNEIHSLARSLPEKNYTMLELIVRHLAKVADNCSRNLMTISNLGVCFGPTLLRPEEESVAALVDIKFYNIVIEVLVEHWKQIFLQPPPTVTLHRRISPADPGPTVPPVTFKPGLKGPEKSLNGAPSSNNNNSNSVYYSIPMDLKTESLPGPGGPVSPGLRVTQTVARLTTAPPYPGAGLRTSSTSALYHCPLASPLASTSVSFSALNSSAPGSHTVTPVASARDLNAGGMNDRFGSGVIRDRRPAAPAAVAAFPRVNFNGGSPSVAGVTVVDGGGPAASVGPVEHRERGPRDRTPAPLVSKRISTFQVPPPGDEKPRIEKTPPQKAPQRGAAAVGLRSGNVPGRNGNKPGRNVRTLYQCHADGHSELSFEPNEIITKVHASDEPGWLYGELRGRKGLIPENYVEDVPMQF